MVKIHHHTVASIYFKIIVKSFDFQVKMHASFFPRYVTLMPVDIMEHCLPGLPYAKNAYAFVWDYA